MANHLPAARPSGLVTPEAVPLDVELAGVPTRALAAALDVAVVGGAFIVVGIVVGLLGLQTSSTTVAVVLGLLALFAGLFAYPAVLETFTRGRTVGKMALGLRVVTVEGTPVRFRHGAIRSALRLVDVLLVPIGFVGVTSVLLTRRRQRLGDAVAGTIVVRERSGAGWNRAMAFPPLPGWEAYTASLDTSALDAEHYELVRSFLVRAGQLRPDARAHLATDLANGVAGLLGHTPPPGVAPEPFLVTVAAAHQRRSGTWQGAPGPWGPTAGPG